MYENEELNGQEPSTVSELSNMGRKAVGTVGNAANLALGMGKKLHDKKNNDENKNTKDEDKKDENDQNKNGDSNSDGKSSIDEANDVGKNIAKKGANVVKEGVKATGKGLKALWNLIPFPYNIISIVGITLILIVFFVIFLGTGASQGEMCYITGQEFDLSDIELSTATKVYENGLINWNKDSQQYAFFTTNETYTDENGFMRVKENDDYIVALGQYFGTTIGTRYLVVVEGNNGEEIEFTVTLGDSKNINDSHSSPDGKYHEIGGTANILEFLTACDSNHSNHGLYHTGDVPTCKEMSYYNNLMNNVLFPGEVVSISLLEGEQECNQEEGEFYQRYTSIYHDSEALDNIFAYAPGIYYYNWSYNLKYQCVTYAKLRAVEIIITATNYDDDTRYNAALVFNNNFGNGWQWTPNTMPALSHFDFDSTCTEFKPGSLITFKGNGMKCDYGYGGYYNYCGHVAIIEEINDDGTIRVTDGYHALQGQYHEINWNPDSLKYAYGGCIGITHLLTYHD